jgi:hypothetical protein
MTTETATPLSTDRVRNLYSWAYAWRTEDDGDETDLSATRERQRVEFDAWLRAHDAEVWDEGYKAGDADEAFRSRGLSSDPDAAEHPHDNPYR